MDGEVCLLSSMCRKSGAERKEEEDDGGRGGGVSLGRSGCVVSMRRVLGH